MFRGIRRYLTKSFDEMLSGQRVKTEQGNNKDELVYK